MGGKMLIRNVKSKAEKWFRSLRDAVASKITTKRERPMLAKEAEKFDAKWSMSSQSSLDHRRDFEADPSNDNAPCTCEVEFMLPEDDDAGSDSSEIRGYWKLSNESCTVRPYAQLDQAALQRSYRKLEAGCLHFSLIKGNGKAGAKLIGWNIELTRINVAMMKASQEFKSAVWLDLCRRHNTDRWVRKYFVWTWNIHDQDHVDRVYKSLIKNSGCSNVT
ncbi:hypothetical protein CGCSCA2_v006017 [Colletotrichum siamense]|uniref:Uncharacterized protein n=1 Tax=Colletotrichum siamense TaxID=690259 RepID=A0A9P5EUK6_COLSI|nr:hypothetical protein CGCSCA2_v006017 [Colletotrichum siamense]